jgi:hypothetical protein
MARREIYEAGRADERSEVVAWLRDVACTTPAKQTVLGLAADIERGRHAEAVVLGAEVGG